ncbi:MAG: hypothetical protein KAS32_16780 [Candidatus Peribacteraceae bacterium]|nr:hypothetical protein [Candidatus Peribacteraceae bacterium]
MSQFRWWRRLLGGKWYCNRQKVHYGMHKIEYWSRFKGMDCVKDEQWRKF